MDWKRSADLYERARRILPGGVSSPVRAYAPHPLYLTKGEGAFVWDADGNRYVDLCLAFGPLILGHAPEGVRAAAAARLAEGWLFGAANEPEVRLAEAVRARMPHVEMLRFVTTGTEATMHAIRLARAATGREVVVKVDGAFHGSHDAVLVKAGSGVATASLASDARTKTGAEARVAATHALPDSPGVPAAVAALTRVVPWNDAAAMEAALAPGDVACVLVEPVLANVGVIPPAPGYLAEVRRLATAHGALLVFDEIITGFRVARGGAAELYGVTPDLTTLGKVLGGGLPLAAYGGRRDLLERVAPQGPVYQAGTYAGNPMSLAAGLATLDALTPAAYAQLEAAGRRLEEGLRDRLRRAKVPHEVPRVGSLLNVFFRDGAPATWAEARTSDRELFWRLHRGLLREGVYVPPSPFEAWFLSTAHDDATIDAVADAAARALA